MLVDIGVGVMWQKQYFRMCTFAGSFVKMHSTPRPPRRRPTRTARATRTSGRRSRARAASWTARSRPRSRAAPRAPATRPPRARARDASRAARAEALRAAHGACARVRGLTDVVVYGGLNARRGRAQLVTLFTHQQGTLGPAVPDKPPDFEAMVRGFESSGPRMSVDAPG